MTVDTSAPIAIRNPIQPRTVFRLPAVLCGGAWQAREPSGWQLGQRQMACRGELHPAGGRRQPGVSSLAAAFQAEEQDMPHSSSQSRRPTSRPPTWPTDGAMTMAAPASMNAAAGQKAAGRRWRSRNAWASAMHRVVH